MSSSQKRILCVEDQEDMCELLTAILRSYKVISACSKAEAICLVVGERFDLILVELLLARRHRLRDMFLHPRVRSKDPGHSLALS